MFRWYLFSRPRKNEKAESESEQDIAEHFVRPTRCQHTALEREVGRNSAKHFDKRPYDSTTRLLNC